jgi:hypothetical protein
MDRFLQRVRIQTPEEHAELHLQVGRQLSDFVEEDAASVGDFKLAFLLCDCRSEGALLVPKQFRFRQLTLEYSTVHHDEGCVRPRTVAVDGMRNQFLPVPLSPANKNCGIGRRHADDEIVNFLDRVAVADQLRLSSISAWSRRFSFVNHSTCLAFSSASPALPLLQSAIAGEIRQKRLEASAVK